jgi:PAS domain S-box-containing protein
MIHALLVDDEPSFLEQTKFFIERDGKIQVDTATSAQLALSMMAEKSYDAIVADYQMPGMDGIELLKTLRGKEDDIPFILFTGKGREDVVIEALNSGADYYLQKGGDPKSLFAELSNMIMHSASRRRAELELHESERRFRDMLDNVHHIAIILDMEGRLTYGNDRLFKITGKRKDDVIGSDWFTNFLAPEKRESERGTYTRFIKEGAVPVRAHNESEVLTADGETRLISWDHTILKEVDDRIVGIASIGSDITDERKAELSIKEQQHNLMTLLDSIPAYAALRDTKGRCIAVNRRLAELLGTPVENILGKTVYELFPKDLADKYASDDARVLETGESLYTEEETTRGDRRIMVGTRKDPLRGMDGKIAGIVSLAFDITERKEVETELRRLNRALRVLSMSDEMIVRSGDELELIRSTCLIVVDEGGYKFSWTGLAVDDENKSVRPVTHCGLDDGYLDSVNITWADTERGRGPTGTAIRTGKVQLMRDIHRDPSYAAWRDEALKRGYSSSIALPLTVGLKVIGALNVYSAQPDAFDKAEVDLLTRLANDLSFGIELLRTRAAEVRASRETATRSYMLDCVADAVVASDDKWRINYWNRAAEDLYGWKAEEVMGKTGEVIFNTQFIGASREESLRKLRETGHLRGEVLQLTKGGSRILVEATASSMKDAEGRVTGFLSVNRDLAPRKEAEKELVESEKRYKTVFESSGAGTIVVENDMTVSMVNAEFTRMSEYSLGEIVGRKFTDFVPREELPRLATYHRQRRKDQTVVPKNYELKLLTKSGKPKIFQVSVSIIPGTAKSIVSLLDITERLQAEKVAKDAERFMGSVFSSIQDGISILDKDFRIVKVNAAMERWYAHSMPLTGKKCHEAYHGRDEPCAVCPTLQTLRTGKVAVEVVPRRGPALEVLGYQEVFSFPQIDPISGEMEGVIEYIRDISERKRYEDALRQANEKLNLLGSVTRHDALNQLGVLTGWLSIALDSTQDKDLHEYLKKCNDAANMIRAQLEFTANYQEMGIRGPLWISMDTAFSRGVAGLRFGDVAVTQDLRGIEIYVDPMIDKVFHNLADNSLRHGGKLTKIEVWTERSGEELRIVFSDDGQGIQKTEKTKVFSHGYGKHTGYGLYMARAILGITNITIDEIGEPGEGAKFVITVPPQKFRVNAKNA